MNKGHGICCVCAACGKEYELQRVELHASGTCGSEDRKVVAKFVPPDCPGCGNPIRKLVAMNSVTGIYRSFSY